jgi:TOTE conflict system primase-like protein
MVWSDDLVQHLVSTCVGRTDRYLLQRENGRYRPVLAKLTYDRLRDHLAGSCTLATYAIAEDDLCRFAVFDSDADDGLFQLFRLQQVLGELAVPSYLERSRRGGHLWVFLEFATSPHVLRQALLPFCPSDVEFFPSHDTATFEHPGYPVRLPLGIHRKTGCRYLFVEYCSGDFVSVARTITETLLWLSTVERVSVETIAHLAEQNQLVALAAPPRPSKKLPVLAKAPGSGGQWRTIVEWCVVQDPHALIGRYVALDARGVGSCPFGWHHSDGEDAHPSLVVYNPVGSDVMCWWCRAWKQGGSVFDFLRYWYGLDARELWHRILSGEQF